jgi:two-component system nitrogen regulation response regulator NtrX
VNVPGLSERREDIPELIEDFIVKICEASGMSRRRLSDDALAMLQVRAWPGNLRQLRNNVERMLILASGAPAEPITAAMLPAEAMVTDQAVTLGAERMIALPLREAREVFERDT